MCKTIKTVNTMAETRKIVQLHKKDDKNDLWIPLNTGECVQLTDYENNGETGDIEQTDDLNNALAKLENRKADKGETLAEYNITNAYTKDEVDALLSGIYRVQGGLASADIHSTLEDANTKVGDVYDLTDDATMTADFKEYTGTAVTIPRGTNIVVVNVGTEANPVYKFDVLALNVSGSIQPATANDLGGIKIGYTDSTVGSRNYAVQLESQTNKAFVNVPWTDTGLPTMTTAGLCLKIVDNGGTLEASWQAVGTVTSITAGAGLNTTSNDTSTDGGTITGTGTLHLTKSGATAGSYGDSSAQSPSFGSTFKVPYITVDKYGRVTGISEHTVTLPTPSSYSLPTASSNTLGGIYLGYSDSTANTRNYPVQLDGNSKAFVNVPWTDTNLIPDQTGNNNKFLMTNGSTLSWATPSDLNTFRVIQVDDVQLLATDANKAFDIKGGKNITLTTDSTHSGYSSMTIDVSATNHYVTSGDLVVTSGACELEVESGHNYFVGSTADVSSLTALSSLTVVIGSDSNGACESNIFFKTGASFTAASLTFEDAQGNAVSVKVIGDEPTYETNGEYLMSYYKGTVIFGELTVRQ